MTEPREQLSELALSILLEAAQQAGGEGTVRDSLDTRVAVTELTRARLAERVYSVWDDNFVIRLRTTTAGDELAQKVLQKQGAR